MFTHSLIGFIINGAFHLGTVRPWLQGEDRLEVSVSYQMTRVIVEYPSISCVWYFQSLTVVQKDGQMFKVTVWDDRDLSKTLTCLLEQKIEMCYFSAGVEQELHGKCSVVLARSRINEDKTKK